ncbi:Ig-like domain-containing protein, partial [Coprococcus sp. RTP21428st1_B10_RTP21428_210409]
MKRSNRFMAVIAVILAFALTFTGVSIPVNAAATSTVKSITVKNLPSNTLTLKARKTFTLKTNTTSGNLKFSTSNKKIVTVSSTGKIKAVKKGSANITIYLKSNAKIKKVVKVTVGQPATRVKVNKSALTIKKGRSAVIKATVGPNTTSNKKVIWKSSNSKIAKVSATGRVTAVKGGTVTITAVAADGSGKKAVCKVTVKAPITSLKFSKISGKLYVGKTMQLSPVIKPAYATNKKCAWSSSNDKVAMVNSEGKVYAVAAGTAVITAKATDGTGKKATYKVTVAKANTIASATVSDPQTVQVTLSGSQKLPASSFVVKASTVLNGTYNYTIPLDGVTTKDNKTYTIALRRGCSLSDYVRVCVYVDGLYGT